MTVNGDPASQVVSGLVSIRSYDDDDDHDFYHGSGTGGGETTVDANEIIQLVAALNGVQAYKVYKPTAYVSPTASDICNSQGANGVFLTSLNGSNDKNVGAKAFAIDTYSSRSGGKLPPIPKPNPAVKPNSSESCINDNFASVVPLLQSGSLLAIKNTGSSIYSQQELKSLSSNKLDMKSWGHALNLPHLKSCHLMTKVKL